MKRRNKQAVVKIWTVNDKAVRYMLMFPRTRKVKCGNTVEEQVYDQDFDYLATKDDIEMILDFDELENCKLDTREHIVVDRKVPREELTIDKLETDYLRGILKDDYYMYDFLKDRRGDLDILDLERTGIISAEEATYRHVIRYAKDNAWYYYRYNLEQYFKDNHIPVPDFDLDEQGFMIDKITRKKLCPL